VAEVSGQHPQEVQARAEAVRLAAKRHLGAAAGKLGHELVVRDEAHFPSLAHLEVLTVDDVAAAEDEVHAGENILGEVEPLGSLGQPALGHHGELLHDVRMAVVLPGEERPVHGALEQGAEDELARRGEVGHRA